MTPTDAKRAIASAAEEAVQQLRSDSQRIVRVLRFVEVDGQRISVLIERVPARKDAE